MPTSVAHRTSSRLAVSSRIFMYRPGRGRADSERRRERARAVERAPTCADCPRPRAAREIRRRSPAPRDVDHRAHQEAYHVVQKAIGLDLEDEPLRRALATPPRPRCNDDRRRPGPYPGPRTRESDACRRASARSPSSRSRASGSVERPLPPPAEGRVRLPIGADVVAVPPSRGAVPCVKGIAHLDCAGDPQVRRQYRVQCPPQLSRLPLERDSHSHRLPARVHASIGASGSQRAHGCVAQPLECALQHSLNRARCRLALPSRKPRAIVMQHQLHHALRHAWKLPERPSLSSDQKRGND